MAEAVERALAQERTLFCEAGTGTGKTLAYLLPAMLSGKKVIISTATRALQEQIVGKDLPLVAQTFGLRPRVAVMKGLQNYVCLRRYEEFRSSPEAGRPRHARALEALVSFTGNTETGDIGELASFSEDEPIWREVTASSDTRVGAACPHYRDCFVTRMKREAEAAQIVVVNHHLFFADLALRGPHPGRVLPDYDAVIFDEAHQLEDIATDFFGMRVSQARIERVLRDADRALRAAGQLDPLFAGGAGSVLTNVSTSARALFDELTRQTQLREGRATLERDVWQGPLAERWHALDGALEAHEALLESTRGRLTTPHGETGQGASRRVDAGELLDQVMRRNQALREHLAAIVEGARGRVTWFERSRQSTVLSSSPIDLSHVFRSRLFETVPALVLTSATLTNALSRSAPAEPPAERADEGDPAPEVRRKSAFQFLRQRLGALEPGLLIDELIVPSPFDFEQRSLLYTPRDLPAPSSPLFIQRAAARVAELVQITGGGAFVLTTSLRSMHALHALLARSIPEHELLLQGQMPKGALVSAFRAAGDGVLVATSSFWEGVDVPGSALRLVVLEKIPFPVPTDPVVQARTLALESEGKNPFMDYHVPTAALALKQGFGRLIRSRSDAGIVALLDERVHRRGYGQRLLSSLPNARRTSDIADVREFWASLAAPAEVAHAEPGLEA
jgi:ATP-dependent DNA helicase DinG